MAGEEHFAIAKVAELQERLTKVEELVTEAFEFLAEQLKGAYGHSNMAKLCDVVARKLREEIAGGDSSRG